MDNTMTPEEREIAIFYVALSAIIGMLVLAAIYTYAITP
jgi:hypothetical protein